MIDLIARSVMPAALSLLPPEMDTPAARAMLLAIGLQESKFLARRQGHNGPARGFWQFERGGGVFGVLMHAKTARLADRVLRELRYEPLLLRTGRERDVHIALEHNDILAAAFARLLLWTAPGVLPTVAQASKGWQQYLDVWRPGKPHKDTWPSHFAEAWARVAHDNLSSGEIPVMTTDEKADALNIALMIARRLEVEGRFARARGGDQKAASLFARLVAYGANPSARPEGFGWLSKTPGETGVDGYAEDAIVYGDDPAVRDNVIDLVNGAGAPSASIGGSWKERRHNNLWVAPKPLTSDELTYLGQTQPQPPPSRILDKASAFARLTELNDYYAAADGLQRPGGMIKEGRVDLEAVAQWFHQMAIEGVPFADVKAQIRRSDEWRSKHPGETP